MLRTVLMPCHIVKLPLFLDCVPKQCHTFSSLLQEELKGVESADAELDHRSTAGTLKTSAMPCPLVVGLEFLEN